MSIPVMRSLSDGLNQGYDNLLLLRLIAAVLVIFGHSYALSPSPGMHDFIGMAGWGPGIYTGSIAVDIFFVVSGFLVSGSYIKRQDLYFFLRSRMLRILPGYLACLILTAFVLGLLVTRLPAKDYLTHPDTVFYVLGNAGLTNLVWHLPGVFESNPHAQVVNGSLWTLPAEVRMYLLVAAFGAIGLLHRRKTFNFVLGALFVAALWFPTSASDLFSNDSYLRLAALFALGAFFYVNREFIPLNGYIAALLCFLSYALHGLPHFMSVFGLTLAYGCLWFAYEARLPNFKRMGDYSYGVYLWGFPTQQMVMHVNASLSPMQLCAWSVPVALILAIASWHYIEKPALRLKNIPIRQWPSHLKARFSLLSSKKNPK